MRRVLAPGGRAVILDFGKPENPVAAARAAKRGRRLIDPVPGLQKSPTRSRAALTRQKPCLTTEVGIPTILV
jgi:ubiquinone/menaquinone biosynthesis C-methylase UbiE